MKKSKLIYSLGTLSILTSPLLLASVSCGSSSEKENLYTSSYFQNLSESERELLLDEIATDIEPDYNTGLLSKIGNYRYYYNDYVDYYDPITTRSNYRVSVNNITFVITYDIFDKISYQELPSYIQNKAINLNGKFFEGISDSFVGHNPNDSYYFVLNRDKLENAINDFKTKNNSPILKIGFWFDSYERFLFDSWFWDYFPELRVIENEWRGISAYNIDTGILNNLPPKLIEINGFGKKNDLTQIDFSNNKKLRIIFDSFDYNNITQLNLPDSLKIIDGFKWSPLLKSVNFSNSLEIISGFYDCKISNLQFPNSLKYLELFAFDKNNPHNANSFNYQSYDEKSYNNGYFVKNVIPSNSFQKNLISTISVSRKFQPYFESQAFLDNNNGITPTITYID